MNAKESMQALLDGKTLRRETLGGVKTYVLTN